MKIWFSFQKKKCFIDTFLKLVFAYLLLEFFL